MKFNVLSQNLTEQTVDCIVISIFENKKLSKAARIIDDASDGTINAILEQGDISGKAGQNVLLYQVKGIQASRVLLMGCGKKKAFNRAAVASRTKQSLAILDKKNCQTVILDFAQNFAKSSKSNKACYQIVMSALARHYQPDQLKTKDKKKPSKINKLGLWINRGNRTQAEQSIRQAKAIATGLNTTKSLADLAGNICTPTYLADQAIKLAKKYPALSVNILEEADMAALKMDSLLSVSRGSRQPAKLIIMEYKGAKSNEKPIVLVGKGLTFDAGGISIKPSARMDEMKYDMCGGATVFGVMQSCLELKLPINFIGVVPSSENLPDGDANKPGDIVTSMSGQTIEILNTDAEGRLILCDALTYVERFKPQLVIDIATLTGACIVALGDKASGVMGNNKKLIKQIKKASKKSKDRVWQLPLWDDYDKQLASNFADMANIGGAGAGTITAGCFLARYTQKYPWAHLDIAGTAWNGGKDKGATGRPVELLSTLLIQQAK